MYIQECFSAGYMVFDFVPSYSHEVVKKRKQEKKVTLKSCVIRGNAYINHDWIFVLLSGQENTDEEMRICDA